MFKLLREASCKVTHGLRERLDVRGTVREIRGLGRKYGLRFMVAAAVWEVIESLVIPGIMLRYHQPALALFFVLFHFEPVVYPVLFYAFRSYDRVRGRIPWEPDRGMMSSSKRTAAKVTLYRMVSVAVFWALLRVFDLNQWALLGYSALMSMFYYVHERLWHDLGWGITADDQVTEKRVIAKVLTYRAVSVLVMGGAIWAVLPRGVPRRELVVLVAAYQASMLTFHVALEAVWAKSSWGIVPAKPSSSVPAGT